MNSAHQVKTRSYEQPACQPVLVRFVSRALLFDIVLGVTAALIVANSEGTTRNVATATPIFYLTMVPWHLVTDRRRSG